MLRGDGASQARRVALRFSAGQTNRGEGGRSTMFDSEKVKYGKGRGIVRVCVCVRDVSGVPVEFTKHPGEGQIFNV